MFQLRNTSICLTFSLIDIGFWYYSIQLICASIIYFMFCYTHFDSFDNQISAKLSFTVQTFKKQNSMDIEKYNGLKIDVHYLVRQPK